MKRNRHLIYHIVQLIRLNPSGYRPFLDGCLQLLVYRRYLFAGFDWCAVFGLYRGHRLHWNQKLDMLLLVRLRQFDNDIFGLIVLIDLVVLLFGLLVGSWYFPPLYLDYYSTLLVLSLELSCYLKVDFLFIKIMKR